MPAYDFDKIKFGTDKATFEKAVDLYEKGRVIKFREELNGFFATVIGTRPYDVYVDNRHYDRGDCECYLGQNDILCKHMVAVAIRAVMGGKSIDKNAKNFTDQPMCSGKIGELDKAGLDAVKKSITSTMRFIKSYSGPSRTWFAYQSSLSEGCNRLSAIVAELPVSRQTAKILIDMLLKLDNRLCKGGVDDSDGIVGCFVDGVVNVLVEYANIDSNCIKSFEAIRDKETCFGWEEPLVKFLK